LIFGAPHSPPELPMENSRCAARDASQPAPKRNVDSSFRYLLLPADHVNGSCCERLVVPDGVQYPAARPPSVNTLISCFFLRFPQLLAFKHTKQIHTVDRVTNFANCSNDAPSHRAQVSIDSMSASQKFNCNCNRQRYAIVYNARAGYFWQQSKSRFTVWSFPCVKSRDFISPKPTPQNQH